MNTIIQKTYSAYDIDGIAKRVMSEAGNPNRVTVAIDGRAGAGKTTLANSLSSVLSAGIIRMDDFFLRQEQRTANRLSEPGGNIDRERFCAEVLPHLGDSDSFTYRRFDCSNQTLGEQVLVTANRFMIIEGSYSCHPAFYGSYDLHIFVDIDTDLQKQRIVERNGEESAKRFFERWIPLEESYFDAFQIRNKCEIYIKAGN